MSRQIQIRRGTAAEHENFTGAIGEITMDTTNKTLRVHDGETAGGTALAKRADVPSMTAIIASIMPDYANALEIMDAPDSMNPYTLEQNACLYIEVRGNHFSQVNCIINGKTFVVGRGNNTSMFQSVNLTLYVKCGDTFYLETPAGGPYDYHIYIIPLYTVL